MTLTDSPSAAPSKSASRPPRVLLVAPHASTRFGGEAVLPVHYFRGLRQRGVEVWLLVHERTRRELLELFPEEAERLQFVNDDWLQRALWWPTAWLPPRIHRVTLAFIMRLLEGFKQRRRARQLVREHSIDVVHQPIPVSPKEPSLYYDLGAPVVVGPLNGDMSYPPAFADMESRLTRAAVRFARAVSGPLNRLWPGKRRAHTVLVANGRTREALPTGIQGRIVELVENGVDLAVWHTATTPPASSAPDGRTDGEAKQAKQAEPAKQPTQFVFLGRLVACKGVDLLVEAFARLSGDTNAQLTIVGDGPEAPRLRRRVTELGLDSHVTFTGWLNPQACAHRLTEADALVLPSLLECGGAVVLEAMACARPVIATRWGGPTDYLDETCGILIDPRSRSAMITSLTEAMGELAASPAKRRAMGEAGRARIEAHFDWNIKIARMLAIYHEAAGLPVPATLEAETEPWRDSSPTQPALLVDA